MIGGLFTTLFALLVVFSGRSMAAERQLTWNGSPDEPAFDHWGCCECNGVPDQCLGICFCDSNADDWNDWKEDDHHGHCSKYVPEIGLCRNKCPNTTWKPPTTRRPFSTVSPSTAKPTTVHHNASKAKCARRLPKRTWTCAEETGPRTCCVKAPTTSTAATTEEDLLCGDYGCLDLPTDYYDLTNDDY